MRALRDEYPRREMLSDGLLLMVGCLGLIEFWHSGRRLSFWSLLLLLATLFVIPFIRRRISEPVHLLLIALSVGWGILLIVFRFLIENNR